MSRAGRARSSQSSVKQVVGADIDPRTGRPRTSEPSRRAAGGGGGADAALRRIPVVGAAYSGLIDRSAAVAVSALAVFTLGVSAVMTVVVLVASQALVLSFGAGSSAAVFSQLLVPAAAAVPVVLGRGWRRLWRPAALLVLSLVVMPGALVLVLAAGFARIVWVELSDTSVFDAAVCR